MVEERLLTVRCKTCFYMNPVTISLIYDGFEGDFLCRNCGEVLDNLHEMIED